MLEKLLSEKEAAILLDWSVKTLQARRMRGEPPKFHKLGRSVRYSMTELQAFVDGGLRSNTTEVA